MSEPEWRVEDILDHYDHPRFRGRLSTPTVWEEGGSPGCSDRLRVELAVDGQGVVREYAFSGRGCTLSQAAASMIGPSLVGMAAQQLQGASSGLVEAVLGRQPLRSRPACATLALELARRAAARYCAGDREPA